MTCNSRIFAQIGHFLRIPFRGLRYAFSLGALDKYLIFQAHAASPVPEQAPLGNTCQTLPPKASSTSEGMVETEQQSSESSHAAIRTVALLLMRHEIRNLRRWFEEFDRDILPDPARRDRDAQHQVRSNMRRRTAMAGGTGVPRKACQAAPMPGEPARCAPAMPIRSLRQPVAARDRAAQDRAPGRARLGRAARQWSPVRYRGRFRSFRQGADFARIVGSHRNRGSCAQAAPGVRSCAHDLSLAVLRGVDSRDSDWSRR